MANTTLNEFLLSVIGAHVNCIVEVGDMNFWAEQYQLWQDGIRDGRIHDTTAKIMIPIEASEKSEEDDTDLDDDGQPTEYQEWQDYMGGDDWDHGQYDQGGY